MNSRIPKARKIQEFLSDDIIKEFVNQLDWEKDCLFGDVYKDIVKIDQIKDAKFKINKGFMSGEVFLKILEEAPVFTFEDHSYRLQLSNFYRTGLTPKKHIDKWPRFHVRKIASTIKAAV